MTTSVRIHIDQPCHENWQAMTPTEQGRFCGSCQKNVVDFSTMTDKEILDYISTAGSQICARATSDQLNRDIQGAEKKKRYTVAYLWNLLLASFLITRADAQITPVKRPVTTTQAHDNVLVGSIAIPVKKDIHVKGTVIDSTNGEPVPGASIRIKGSHKGVQADSVGKFQLSLVDEVELEVSSVGFSKKTIRVGESQPLTVALSRQDMLGEVVVVAPAPTCIKVFAGGVSVVETVSIPEKIERTVSDWLPNKEVKVFPNPVIRGNNLQVSLALPQTGSFKLVLMDAAGKVMMVQPLQMNDKKRTIQLSTYQHWSAGIYWIRITGKNLKKVYQAKLLLK